MTRIKRIVLMTILYVSLFAASFFLVTYFNGYHFLEKSFLQLMSGILALIVSVSTIFVLFKRSNYQLKDLIMISEGEETEENPTADAQTTIRIPEGQDNQLEQQQMQIADQFVETSSLPVTGEQAQETIPDQPQQPVTEEQQPETEAEIIDETAEQTESVTDLPQPLIQEEEKPAASAVSEPVITIKEQRTSDPLTETQITYINASANSYINEKGLPQLVMTNDLSKEDIERRKHQYENPEEIINPPQTEVSHDEELDEGFYVQDEQQERLVSILVRIIAFLIVVLLVISGYYIYSRFLG